MQIFTYFFTVLEPNTHVECLPIIIMSIGLDTIFVLLILAPIRSDISFCLHSILRNYTVGCPLSAATQSGILAHTERKSQTSLLRLVSIPEGY